MVAVPAHGQAFLIGCAGLLDIDIDVTHGANYAQRVMRKPPRVGVGDEPVAGSQSGRDCPDAFDVDVRVTPDFKLKTRVALCAIVRHPIRHSRRGIARYRPVQRDRLRVAAA